MLAVLGVGFAASGSGAEVGRVALLDRATAYVERFFETFANVVADEVYVQEQNRPRMHRRLRSELLLVRYPGMGEWHVFRDVYEVDGNPVRQDRDRLVDLLNRPGSDLMQRAQQLASESARYHLVDVGTVNHPLLAVAILQRSYRDRFSFRPRSIRRILGTPVRVVDFEEVQTPTILRQKATQDLPMRGSLWIDESTGRIAKSELRLGRHSPATIAVVFGVDAELGIDVPVEMRTSYPVPGHSSPSFTGGFGGAPSGELGTTRGRVDGEVRGIATYSRFRRFRVTTQIN